MTTYLPIALRSLRWLILAALLISAGFHQFNYTLSPLWNNRRSIPEMLARTDAEKLAAMAPDISALVRAVNSTPPQTRFYFVPSFADSGNNGRPPTHVLGILRYLCYPRLILTHDEAVYEMQKPVYMGKLLKGAKTWADIDWIASRNIRIIILIRNNKALFLPVTAPVDNI